MFLTELFEAQTTKHASFCFGRMNPPTVGHAQLIDTVAKSAHGGDYFVFVSQTQDKKKNPLDYATKIKFIRALFPKYAAHIVQDASLNTIMMVAQFLYQKGYRSVTFVAGSDRLDNFKELLNKYNGVEGNHNFYKFNTINFVSSGDRDPDADGIAGVSASAARDAAARGDLVGFTQATDAGALATKLYDAVRNGMLLEGETDPYKKYPRAMFPDTKARNMRNAAQKRLDNIKRKKEYDIGNNGSNTSPYGSADYSSVSEHIVKHGSEYRILSKKTGKNMGTFPSKAAAEKHEREIQYFKHMSESSEEPLAPGYYFYQVPDRHTAITAGLRQTHSGKWHYQIKDPSKYNLSAMQAKLDRMAINHADKLFGQHKFWNPMEEDSSGYIPKNKREAKDPRWSNALTVDVHPDTPAKNLKAFKLA